MHVLRSGHQRFSGRFEHFSSVAQNVDRVMVFVQRVVS